MMEEIHALNREMDCHRCQDFYWRPLRVQECEVPADAAQWQGARHRRAIPGRASVEVRQFN